MKSKLRNEIKSYIVRQGMTMQEVVDLLRDEHGWSDSVSNLSNMRWLLLWRQTASPASIRKVS